MSFNSTSRKKQLVIYGTGQIAEVAAFYFGSDSDYEVSAFTNAAAYIEGDTFSGKPVVPFEEVQNLYEPIEFNIFIALGYVKTNKVRQSRYTEAKEKGYACATYISSRAAYYGTTVGDNCFILEDNVIQPKVTIGNNVTLWSGNHIGHHSIIRDHCFISSHVVISGNCDIGDNCFLGVNSALRDNVKLGRYVVVGSGALVMKDCEERTVVKSPESDTVVIKRDVI
jgi:sugar O-acyltransferase (sialic acid O-acetyltransferase NeuD family)